MEDNCAECGHSVVCHDGYSCDFPYDGWENFETPVGCLCPRYRAFVGELDNGRDT